MKNKIVVIIPTYNESKNVEFLLNEINNLNLDLDLLFIDDNSPDLTGNILDSLAKKQTNVTIIHRPIKSGIGSAHKFGLKWAYENDYCFALTMDADFTHSPEYIPTFIEKINDADIIIGSRYLVEDGVASWNLYRKTLTKLGHFITKLFLNMPYDSTGAFRMYNLKKIPLYFLNSVNSNGYSFFYESLFVLYFNKYKIIEIPTILPARVYGSSKMKYNDIFSSLTNLVHTFLTKKINKEKYIVAEPFMKTTENEILDPQNWNSYWAEKQNKTTFLIYDLIAAFYRKYIIKRNLNNYILKLFTNRDKILHAGCGGGQVDIDICENLNVTALDISSEALSIYKKSNKKNLNLILGSIFNLPFENNSYNGIYNLGVMEHFTELEINKILNEFNRVLQKGGKLILLWPPEYGLSVIFLKFTHFILNKILRKNIELHPAEITRVKNKRQINTYLIKSNFKLVSYNFNYKDMFTYCIIVAEKI
jgi:dolichol-phosphate mannosyltransferase